MPVYFIFFEAILHPEVFKQQIRAWMASILTIFFIHTSSCVLPFFYFGFLRWNRKGKQYNQHQHWKDFSLMMKRIEDLNEQTIVGGIQFQVFMEHV